MITVVVNGEARTLDERATLGDLCRQLELPARGTAVALNFTVVPRSTYAATELREGDTIDIVSASAGG